MSTYLDCNATHPLLPSVRKGMAHALVEENPMLMNPSSIHRVGQESKKMLAQLKARLCEYLGRGEADEWVLLSGATEALNLAARAFVDVKRAEGQKLCLVTSAVEHSAVLDTFRDLADRFAADITLRILDVDRNGQLDIAATEALLAERVEAGEEILLALQVANNETGVSFDLDALLPLLFARLGPRKFIGHASQSKSRNFESRAQKLWILLDAAQGLGKCDPAFLRRAMHYADYAAFSAHKFGAPSGIGALWLRPGSPFRILQTGGSQERKRRAGTHNSLGIYGWALALEDWLANGATYRQKMLAQRDSLIKGLAQIPGLEIHGQPQLLNTVNFHVEGCPEESLLLALDLEGYSLSSGSACHSGSLKPSHVLLAMGYPEATVLSSLRVCIGVETGDAELQAFLECLRQKVAHIREARRLSAELLPDMIQGGV